MITVLSGCHGASPCAWAPRQDAAAEALAGARAAPAVEAQHGGVIRDAEAEQRLELIGNRLADAIPEIDGGYRYRLLDADRPNAISLPGGRVYFTYGLYRRITSDHQLAAVLAHEMAHIVMRDHFKPRCGSCAEAVSRETLADLRAAQYLRRTGIPCEALVEVIQLVADVQPPGWAESRINALAAFRRETSTVARSPTGGRRQVAHRDVARDGDESSW
ncbi:MAG: M48 family metalloprotease [bacterium]|nr:M48 family metalloprotease [bacterium]